jgi:hypothetical protein
MAHLIIEKPNIPGKTPQRMYIANLHSLLCAYFCLIGLQSHRTQCILSFLLMVNKFKKLIHTIFKFQSLTHKPHQRFNTSNFMYTCKQFQFQEMKTLRHFCSQTTKLQWQIQTIHYKCAYISWRQFNSKYRLTISTSKTKTMVFREEIQ